MFILTFCGALYYFVMTYVRFVISKEGAGYTTNAEWVGRVKVSRLWNSVFAELVGLLVFELWRWLDADMEGPLGK